MSTGCSERYQATKYLYPQKEGGWGGLMAQHSADLSHKSSLYRVYT